MPRGQYERDESRTYGFIRPKQLHTVTVEGITEPVYCGHNKREAHFAFRRWVKFSQGTEGRAAGKRVVHITNTNKTAEHTPTTCNAQK